MDARRFWHAVAHRWVALVLLLILGPVIGAIVALELPVHYRATTAVLISSDHLGSIDDLGAGSQLAVDAAPSFATLVTSPAVLSPAITALGLNTSPGQLAPDIRVTVALASSTVTISVTSTGRTAAAALANAVGDQFALLVPKLSPTIEGASAFKATKIEAAYPPASDNGLRVGGGIGIGLAAALALCWAIVAAYASNPVIDRREVATHATRVPVLGTIATVGRKLAHAASSERSLVTTVSALAPRVQCLMVVSPRPGDGRTRTAVNMAVGAAQSSRSVLLVDADLSEPDVARVLDLDESAGLQGILAGTASFADVVQLVGDDGLHVVTAGRIFAGGKSGGAKTGNLKTGNAKSGDAKTGSVTAGGGTAGGGTSGTPGGGTTGSGSRALGHPLLASSAMSRFLATARERYDLVVIDTPPMLTSSDSLALAAQVDGIVVVVDARRTRQRLLTATLRRLSVAGGSVVGIVLNRALPPVQHRHFGADTELKRLAGV